MNSSENLYSYSIIQSAYINAVCPTDLELSSMRIVANYDVPFRNEQVIISVSQVSNNYMAFWISEYFRTSQSLQYAGL